MQKIERLIPCSAFVLHQEEQIKQYTTKDSRTPLAYYNILHYAKFLKQTLELWMFVPCGEDGKPLSEPEESDLDSSFLEMQVGFNNEKKYQSAKERCLFDGFDLIDNQLIFEGDTFWSTLEGHGVSGTIEDISHIQIPLTQTALKEIYGS